MKKTSLLVLLLFFTSKGLADNIEITVAYIDKINPPFVINPNQTDTDNPGITIDILKQLEKTADIQFIYKNMPWARCLYLLETNKVDAIFHASFKKNRMKKGVYPMKGGQVDPQRRLLEQTYYIYKHKDSPLQWDGKTFKNLDTSVGIIIDFSIKNDLQQMKLSYEEAPSIQTNLKKLKNNRLDAVINYASQTDITLYKYPKEFKNIVKLSPPFKKRDKYLIFSHDFYAHNKVLVERLWDELKKMRETGELTKISEKYWN
ncbi:MAG: transporter substrate-binding domain-containing protein [gamma proteobacterium symbiont of Bathyaustriella thionipta]|nr:transporter substrate-binding domain-containing protein [gamma proteobacterium symbiont of Bathyaustriella thionipta]MCU7950516.1 transporter substrate-binding domain-containing protein [gamma proteobacterium symbiont of Bathyaustriella thionipta]MCU7952356.1 transporter substrate-binding domain-containing protein [gamma proteobacterium symbiont of Bathyaustriella thionipta]MCU7957131.1 transporter substrate-binding domain-containing protein [gamma proteobacterium symbiont of Bathyaustriella 